MFDLIILLIVIKIIISVANRNKTGKKKDASAAPMSQENTGLAVFPLEMPENGHRNGCRRRKG